MRIASYNVENLFARPNAFDRSDWSIGAEILAAYEEVNALFQKETYSAADKARMSELLQKLDIYFVNDEGAVRKRYTSFPRWAWLRKNRGKFDTQPKSATKDVVITAAGRADWLGWVELAKEPANETSTRMTARVIADVDADVVGVVEAEDRPSLVRFNEELLDGAYAHVMLVDGNDERGIDVGLMTREGFEIESLRSNVDATDDVGTIFSRDCPEYRVRTDQGNVLHVLVNHFKSKSGGGGGDKRLRQATKVAEIASGLVLAGQHVVVLGDFNEGIAGEGELPVNLLPLFGPASPLVDCYTLEDFDTGPRLGTHDACGAGSRLDYILLSEGLAAKFRGGRIFRKGLWGSRESPPDDWDVYEEMESSADQASDHAAVFVDLDV